MRPTLILVLFLVVSYHPAMAQETSVSEVFYGTLIGPILGIDCIPDAWLRLCQYPDSVMSVTSESIDLSQWFDQSAQVAGSFYLCRDLYGGSVTFLEVKEAWPEPCPAIAVAPASWGFIKTIYR